MAPEWVQGATMALESGDKMTVWVIVLLVVGVWGIFLLAFASSALTDRTRVERARACSHLNGLDLALCTGAVESK